MPGTLGTLLALPFVLIFPQNLSGLALLFAMFSLAVFVSEVYSRTTGHSDPQEVIIDEWVACFFVFFLIPLTLFNLICGVVLFRVLDITKLWPISFIEKKVKGGLGIVLDDVVAALMVNFILHGSAYFQNKGLDLLSN